MGSMMTISTRVAGGMIFSRAVVVSALLGLVWFYLALVLSPVWVPYKAVKGAGRLSHSLGLL